MDTFVNIRRLQWTLTVMKGNEAYTIQQFCRAFGIGRSLVYKEIAAGRLYSRKAGRRTLVLRSDAESWAAALPQGSARERQL